MAKNDLHISAGKKGLFYALLMFIIWISANLVIWAPLYYYIDTVIERMRMQTAASLKVYASLHGSLTRDDDLDPNLVKKAFDVIISQSDIPIINTDANKNPLYWEGIDVDPEDKSELAFNKVKRIIEMLDREIEPIPIIYDNPDTKEKTTLGYLYYGDSELISQLRYLPYVYIGVVNIFILMGLLGIFLIFKSIQKSEQRSIWVGMAKETAHQLGTPLSSLMGWLEIIKSNEMECDVTRKTVGEMEKDVNRLYKVAERFSQIGSRADLTAQDVRPILTDVASYIRRRLPHMRKQVKIIEDFAPVPKIPLNAALFEWVIENLLKNSLDAIKTEQGEILIKVRPFNGSPNRISVDIQDNGIGISAMNKNIIFKPGYSTKKRGWGLGLNLAQRIVEEYHNGKLFIKESRIGEGTTMRIIL